MRARCFLLVGLLLVAGCGGSSSTTADPGAETFAFVVMADPHVSGTTGDAAIRLDACVAWVDQMRQVYGIELVFVVGDLGNTANCKAILDGLDVPYVPIIGDNVIQGGNESGFETALAAQYALLAGTLTNWTKAPLPVANPQRGGQSHFENFSFDHKNVHFVGLDWCTRVVGGGESEQADLHAFAGGTFPWFQADLATCLKPRVENIVMLSHHPMHDILGGAGALASDEMDAVEAFTSAYADHVYANFAGHYHFAWHDAENAGGFEVFVTDATWDDENVVRLVRVFDNGERLTYVHEIIDVGAAP